MIKPSEILSNESIKMEVRKILFFLLLIFAINYVNGKCNVQKLQKSSRENYLKSKLRGSNKIVCPELNNATFTDKSPFHILGLPFLRA